MSRKVFEADSGGVRAVYWAGKILFFGAVAAGVYQSFTTTGRPPAIATGYNQHIEALKESGDYGALIRQFELALLLDAQVGQELDLVHYDLGYAHQLNGDLDLAAKQYQEALAIDPESARSHFRLGQTLGELNRTQEAIGHLQRAAELQPDSPEIHLALADLLNESGRDAKAAAQYGECIRLQPGRPGPTQKLARLLAISEDPAVHDPVEALRLARRAAKATDHKRPTALETLAIAHAASGQFDEATSTIQRAIQAARSTQNESLVPELQRLLERFQQDLAYAPPER